MIFHHLCIQTIKIGEDLIDFNKNSKGIVHSVLDIEKEYNRIKDLGYNDFIKKADHDIYTVEGSKLFKIIAPEGTIIEVRDKIEIF